ncbi:DnaJ-domain-containing protein [Rozella allomycis CSF55]|uniref:DnaJ-domain-containing protein n=1 Tax=Rozella allomycis (strain CSF55) TaxID=988480 RepID=A0A4P9YP99_ROZAC|nr:DnaJ-domain-containing protein [Rozella allomycis CSF55]
MTKEDLDLYEILGVSKDASQNEIKKAYFKLALINHPDKHGEDLKEEQNKMFQDIVFAYSILSDEYKRKSYDTTGQVEGNEFVDSEEYKAQLTAQAIERFKTEYIGSEEEKSDLLRIYTACRGDILRIIDEIFFGDESQIDRYKAIINEAIEEGKVKKYRSFEKNIEEKLQKRRKNIEKEAKEAEEVAKKLGISTVNNEDELVALIRSKNSSKEDKFDSFLSNLEEKYAKPKSKRQKRK